jgi:hypothetical protein
VASGSPVSGTNVHTYSPRQTAFGTNTVTQPYTLEVHRDMPAGNTFQYAGTAVEKLLLQWGVRIGGSGDEAMSAEVDVISQALNFISPTTVSYDALANLFLWNQCKINIGVAGSVTIADIKIDFDMGVEGKAYIDGTNQIHSIVARGPRIVSVTGTMLADINQFNFYKTRTRQDMNIVFTGPALGTNGNFQLMLDMPQVQYITYPIVVPNFQEIMVGFTAKAKFDSAIAQTPALITLTNDVATQY